MQNKHRKDKMINAERTQEVKNHMENKCSNKCKARKSEQNALQAPGFIVYFIKFDPEDR